MTDILCGGLVALDLVYHVDAAPEPGSKQRAGAAEILTGGGAQNAAAAIAGLGGRAWLVGHVGDDGPGAMLRDRLRARGIRDDHLAALPGVGTPHSAILVTPDGDRTIVNWRDDRLDRAADLPPGLGCDAVLVDTRFPTLAEALLARAAAAGKPGVVDAEAPLAPAGRLLALASHVAFSEQGLRDFEGAADAAALARAAARLGRWVCVTRGAAPVLVHDGARLTEIAPPVVTARNTLGAGDVWHGAFTLDLARGRPAIDAVAAANLAAAAHVSGAQCRGAGTLDKPGLSIKTS